jgi:hypothetical protein
MIVDWSKKLLAVVGALGVSVTLAATAQAFTFSQVSGFVNGTETSSAGPSSLDGIMFFGPVVSTTDGSSGLPTGLNTFSTIAWGRGSDSGVTPDLSLAPSFTQIPGPGPNSDKSALQVIGHSGTINVGQTVVLSEIFHRNQVISAPDLQHVDIFSVLHIFDGATPVIVSEDNVPVEFHETPNTAPCNPDTQISPTACDDYFTFPLGTFASLHFTVGDDSFTVSFATSCDTSDTSLARCDIPSPDDPTQGQIITAEGRINHLLVLMTLTQDNLAVPAPAALLLVGLGLGAALVRRRRAA